MNVSIPGESLATDRSKAHSSHQPTDADQLHDPRFWRVLLRRVVRRAGRQDAEDLLHSAFIRLERYRAKHAVAKPAAFLVRTAVNIAIDQARHESFKDDLPVDAQRWDFSDPNPLQDEVNEFRKRLKHVRDGLDRLPHRTREVFLMHRLEGLKYREIADRLEISPSAVEKHVSKAALFLADWTDGW